MDKQTLQDTAPRLAIGALSRRTGVNIETVRYYERIGLLPPPARSEGGHRLYGGGHLMRLNFVRRARDLGFTLDEIRALLELAEKRDRPCARRNPRYCSAGSTGSAGNPPGRKIAPSNKQPRPITPVCTAVSASAGI